MPRRLPRVTARPVGNGPAGRAIVTLLTALTRRLGWKVAPRLEKIEDDLAKRDELEHRKRLAEIEEVELRNLASIIKAMNDATKLGAVQPPPAGGRASNAVVEQCLAVVKTEMERFNNRHAHIRLVDHPSLKELAAAVGDPVEVAVRAKAVADPKRRSPAQPPVTKKPAKKKEAPGGGTETGRRRRPTSKNAD